MERLERLERQSELARGPRGERLGALRPAGRTAWRGTRPAVREERAGPAPAPPADWRGGPATWPIYWAHGQLGRGPEWPAGVWAYRRPLFGEVSRLGWVPDFSEYDVQVAIDVVDPALVDPNWRAVVMLRTLQLAAAGLAYILIDEADARTAPVRALQEALAGVTRSAVQR